MAIPDYFEVADRFLELGAEFLETEDQEPSQSLIDRLERMGDEISALLDKMEELGEKSDNSWKEWNSQVNKLLTEGGL